MAKKKEAATEAVAEVAPKKPKRNMTALKRRKQGNVPKEAKKDREEVGPIERLAANALHISLQENEGERGRNAARFQRGELVLELAQIAKASHSNQKQLLEAVNAEALRQAERHNILNYTPISQQEATMTSRVVNAFGSGGEFPLVNAVSKLTGEPLVNDAGEAPTVELTDVALNKLYALASIADGYVDEAVSFAYRHTERVVKKAKSVAQDTHLPLHQVIGAVDAARVKAPHPVTGEPIDVQPEGRDALVVLAGLAGEPIESEIITIKTTRALYDGFFVPLKKLMSAVASAYAPSLVATTTDGLVSNAFVLEQTIVQFFNVFEDDGVNTALAAMIRSETITETQAQDFLNSYAFDQTAGEWKKMPDFVEVEAVAELVDDDDDDDDDDEGFTDEEYDWSEPEDEELEEESDDWEDE